MELDRRSWSERYANNDTGWDLGGPSTPLREYIDGLKDKQLRILIPGAGRAYEAEYLHRRGFTNVFVIDLAPEPFDALLHRYPEFPREHLVIGDLFDHDGTYDLILEQTFFCALDPLLRTRYVKKMHSLLAPGGVLAGVLFDDPLNSDRPPFGGSKAEYLELFGARFNELKITPCYNSIKPRAGREVWLKAVKEGRSNDSHRPKE